MTVVRDILRRVGRRLVWLWKIYAVRDRMIRDLARWHNDRGDATLRLNYPLTSDSVVLDCGGYRGDWANNIFDRFGCNIFIFEPVPEFASFIRARFAAQPKIRIFDYGVGRIDNFLTLHQNGDGSSVFRQNGEPIQVRIRNIGAVLRELNVQTIDVMKVNIEGGEFDLVKHLVDSGLIKQIRDLQVQFHKIREDSEIRYEALQKSLARTHELTYHYYFVWDNWQLRKPESHRYAELV
ncbi:MAG: FkbM family methyltransferase [Acidobacteriaceae bacterium]|nr:FkbM family methyltransferase [Acidobacteriaceae bacterium]MBV9779049.1 FkbM family methyltransferase [Acidobacteriaceae bacterium]